MAAYATENQNGVTLALHLQPGAKREGFVAEYNGRLKVAVKAAAIDGAANEALIRLLADTFRLPKSYITLLTGTASRDKRIFLKDVSLPQVIEIIAALLKPSKK